VNEDQDNPRRPLPRGLTLLWLVAVLLFLGGSGLRGVAPAAPLSPAAAAEENEEAPAEEEVEEEVADLRRQARRVLLRVARAARSLRAQGTPSLSRPFRRPVEAPAPRSCPTFVSPLRV